MWYKEGTSEISFSMQYKEMLQTYKNQEFATQAAQKWKICAV